jgi:hypothetical protein
VVYIDQVNPKNETEKQNPNSLFFVQPIGAGFSFGTNTVNSTAVCTSPKNLNSNAYVNKGRCPTLLENPPDLVREWRILAI